MQGERGRSIRVTLVSSNYSANTRQLGRREEENAALKAKRIKVAFQWFHNVQMIRSLFLKINWTCVVALEIKRSLIKTG